MVQGHKACSACFQRLLSRRMQRIDFTYKNKITVSIPAHGANNLWKSRISKWRLATEFFLKRRQNGIDRIRVVWLIILGLGRRNAKMGISSKVPQTNVGINVGINNLEIDYNQNQF